MWKKLLIIGFCFGIGLSLYAQQIQSGLYAEDSFKGEMDLYDALDWITLNAQEGGEYSVVLGESLALSSNVLDCKGKSVTIHLKSAGSDIQLSYATRSPSSSLFTVKKGVTFVLENGVELIGRSSASRPPVTVDGGNFIMNGGTVKDSKVDVKGWFGGGVDILNGGSFIMNGGHISGNSCSAGGTGVNVGENSTFTMNGGFIEGNRVSADYLSLGGGGVVFVNKNATFIMNRGVISENSHGAVNVNGAFTMVDGTIHNNTGFGVSVSYTGVFVMQGGAIFGNAACGVYLSRNLSTLSWMYETGSAKFIMNGGEIVNNTLKGSGRGVHVDGVFEMNKGVIKGHYTDEGAGVYVENGTFIMNDGAIKENSAWGTTYSSVGGGGVYVRNGKFIMNDGFIEKNKAYKNAAGGGGVFVGGDGTFTMNGGTISGNSASKSGGGVLVDSGTFIKSNTAGIIYGSNAKDEKANQAEQYGHAIYTKNGSRDTTARATMALDSRKQGAEGGWE